MAETADPQPGIFAGSRIGDSGDPEPVYRNPKSLRNPLTVLTGGDRVIDLDRLILDRVHEGSRGDE